MNKKFLTAFTMVLVVCVSALTLSACDWFGKDNSTQLVGVWEKEGRVLEFKSDKTGTYDIFAFTYTVSGDKVNVTLTANGQTSQYTWKVEGTSLILTVGTGALAGIWTKTSGSPVAGEVTVTFALPAGTKVVVYYNSVAAAAISGAAWDAGTSAWTFPESGKTLAFAVQNTSDLGTPIDASGLTVMNGATEITASGTLTANSASHAKYTVAAVNANITITVTFVD